MNKEILDLVNTLEDELVDAYNTGHEGEINSDSLYYIDSAKSTLYDLKEKIKKLNECNWYKICKR